MGRLLSHAELQAEPGREVRGHAEEAAGGGGGAAARHLRGSQHGRTYHQENADLGTRVGQRVTQAAGGEHKGGCFLLHTSRGVTDRECWKLDPTFLLPHSRGARAGDEQSSPHVSQYLLQRLCFKIPHKSDQFRRAAPDSAPRGGPHLRAAREFGPRGGRILLCALQPHEHLQTGH